MTFRIPENGPGGFSCIAAIAGRKVASAVRRSILVVGMLLAALPAALAQGQPPAPAPVLLTDIKGAIGFVTADQLAKAIESATNRNAAALIIRLDTPGGLLSSTRDMTQAMLASRVPIIVYVAPSGARAASAGTYLTYAANVAAMAPGTHIGAATPIALGAPGLPGSPPPPSKPEPKSDKSTEPEPADAAGRKSVNDAVAYIRTLAQLRNRNVKWAEKAVRDAATLTATEALREHVVDVMANDVDDLLGVIDGRSVKTAAGDVKLATKGHSVVEFRPDWKMRMMAVITDPNIAFILFLVGVYGILFEFWSPGAVAPGVVGGISLIVALTALSVLPINYGGFALLLFGIALMIVEAHAPTFGVVGLGGVAAFVLGALFLFEPGETDTPLAVAWPMIAGAAAVSAAFFIGVLGFAMRARQQPVRTGAEQMIGITGEVISWSEGKGKVHVNGESWTAASTQSLQPGDTIRVVERDGLTLLIEPVTKDDLELCGRAKL